MDAALRGQFQALRLDIYNLADYLASIDKHLEEAAVRQQESAAKVEKIMEDFLKGILEFATAVKTVDELLKGKLAADVH